MTETTIKKQVTYVINGVKQVQTISVPMTDDEILEARTKSLKVLIAQWTATDQDKEDLFLLTA